MSSSLEIQPAVETTAGSIHPGKSGFFTDCSGWERGGIRCLLHPGSSGDGEKGEEEEEEGAAPAMGFFFFLFYPLGLRPLRPREAPGASSRGIFPAGPRTPPGMLRRSRPGIGPATCGAHPATFPLPTAKTSPNSLFFLFFFPPLFLLIPDPSRSQGLIQRVTQRRPGRSRGRRESFFMGGKTQPKKSELSSPDSVPR